MIIFGKESPPPSEFWVPDYTYSTLPRKPNGEPFLDPDDYQAYVNWLVVHLENNDFPLNSHHQEILSDPDIKDWPAGRLAHWLGWCSVSLYYGFVEPMFEYPHDYLEDPRPERVCDPDTTEWEDRYLDPDDEEMFAEYTGMLDLRTYLIFDCMCWEAEKVYAEKCRSFPHNARFSDLGWRPMLKVAISRTNDWWEKRDAILSFHKEYDDLSWK